MTDVMQKCVFCSWIFAFAILFSDKPCFVPFAYGSQEGGNVVVIEKNDIISAQVILPSESGKLLNGDTLITSENISEFSPNPATVNKAQKLFRDMGFKVGNAVGVSFSISATAATFEETFKLRVRQTKNKGFEFVQADGTGSNELPKSSFGLFSAGIVETVVFMEAPDFGPSDFSM